MKSLKIGFFGLLTAASLMACGRSSDHAQVKMAPPGTAGSGTTQEIEMNHIPNYRELSPGMSYAFTNQQDYHVEISDDAKTGKLWFLRSEIRLSCNGDTRGTTKCNGSLTNSNYEFSAPIRHGFGVNPYGSAKLTIYRSSNSGRDSDGQPVHRDPVYGERHLSSQEQQVVVQVMRNFAIQTRAAGQFLYCRDLAAQTEAHLIQSGYIYPAANEQEKVAFLLTANLIGLEGLCQK